MHFCSNLNIFVEMHRLVIDVVLHKVIVYTREQGHLGKGEDIHELFHSVPMRTLKNNRSCSQNRIPKQCINMGCIKIMSLQIHLFIMRNRN